MTHLIRHLTFVLFLAGCGNIRFIPANSGSDSAPISEKPDQTRESLGGPIDTDGDGLNDEEEARLGTKPDQRDSDGDGLEDRPESEGPTDPLAFDTDGDGIGDGHEGDLGSDPLDRDTDDDGLEDGLEYFSVGSHLLKWDSDDGGRGDGDEFALGTHPNDASDDGFQSPHKDSDGDGVDDCDEVELNTDVQNPDTDGDGLSDGEERSLGTNPLSQDSDGGGRSDLFESSRGSNPIDNASDDEPVQCYPLFEVRARKKNDGQVFSLDPFVGFFDEKKNYLETAWAPIPLNDKLIFYLYKSPRGYFLNLHANTDHLEDEAIETLNLNMKVETEHPMGLVHADVRSQVIQEDGVFTFQMQHWRSREGAVIGPLGRRFDIEIQVTASSNTDSLIWSSGDGSDHVLSPSIQTELPTVYVDAQSCAAE